MNKREAAIVTCYTDFLIGDIGEVYRYLTEIAGQPVYSHEIPEVCRRYRKQIKEDYIRIKVED